MTTTIVSLLCVLATFVCGYINAWTQLKRRNLRHQAEEAGKSLRKARRQVTT